MSEGSDLYHPIATTASKLVEQIVKDSKIEKIKEIVIDEQKRQTGKLPPLPRPGPVDDTDTQSDSVSTNN